MHSTNWGSKFCTQGQGACLDVKVCVVFGLALGAIISDDDGGGLRCAAGTGRVACAACNTPASPARNKYQVRLIFSDDGRIRARERLPSQHDMHG